MRLFLLLWPHLHVLNLMQYHGGTNFGRTAGGPFIATSYDYDAPIDEFGMQWLQSLTNLNSHGLSRDISRKVYSMVLPVCSHELGWAHLKSLGCTLQVCLGNQNGVTWGTCTELSSRPSLHWFLVIQQYNLSETTRRLTFVTNFLTWQWVAKYKKTSADIHGLINCFRHMSSSRRMEPVLHSCRTTTWRLLWKSGLMGVIMISLLGPSAFCLTAKLRSSTLRRWELTETWIFHSLYSTNGIM